MFPKSSCLSLVSLLFWSGGWWWWRWLWWRSLQLHRSPIALSRTPVGYSLLTQFRALDLSLLQFSVLTAVWEDCEVLKTDCFKDSILEASGCVGLQGSTGTMIFLPPPRFRETGIKDHPQEQPRIIPASVSRPRAKSGVTSMKE